MAEYKFKPLKERKKRQVSICPRSLFLCERPYEHARQGSTGSRTLGSALLQVVRQWSQVPKTAPSRDKDAAPTAASSPFRFVGWSEEGQHDGRSIPKTTQDMMNEWEPRHLAMIILMPQISGSLFSMKATLCVCWGAGPVVNNSITRYPISLNTQTSSPSGPDLFSLSILT